MEQVQLEAMRGEEDAQRWCWMLDGAVGSDLQQAERDPLQEPRQAVVRRHLAQSLLGRHGAHYPCRDLLLREALRELGCDGVEDTLERLDVLWVYSSQK